MTAHRDALPARVFRYLKTKNATSTAVADALGADRRHVENIIRDLRKQGRINTVGEVEIVVTFKRRARVFGFVRPTNEAVS